MRWIRGCVEELLPVILFFVVEGQVDFITGVIAMVLSAVLITGLSLVQASALPKFAIVSTVALLVFAVPTIVTGDTNYFKAGESVMNGGFAVLLLLSLFTKQTLLEYFFTRIFALPSSAWRTLTIRWAVFLLSLAIANEFVRILYSDDVWVRFNIVAAFAIIGFGLWQFRLSRRERIVAESNWLGLRQ